MERERTDWTADQDDRAQDYAAEESYEALKARDEEEQLWALEDWQSFPDIADGPVDDHDERTYAAFVGADYDFESE